LVEIDEVAARLLRQYWAVVLICVAAPLVAIGLLTIRQPPLYAADARIITSSLVPSSATESDALVSQVQAIATGPRTAAAALRAAGANRNLTQFINNSISVSGLGGSQVVDLVVTDHDRQVAQSAARYLSTAVTTSLNHVGESGLKAALDQIDQQIVKLSQRRAALAAKVSANPHNPQLTAQLAGLDEVIANFTGDRGRILIQASTQGLAGVIDAPSLPTHPVSKALPQKLGLAGLLGLVVGIFIASMAEVIRPTLPGAQRVSRRLGTPLLGRIEPQDMRGQVTPGVARLALRIRLAAAHAAVTTVALAETGAAFRTDQLATLLERAVGYGTLENVTAVEGPAGNNHHSAGEQPPGAAGLPSTLVVNRQQPMTYSGLRFYPLADMTAAWEMGRDRVGLVVLSGPVARVSEVSTLADLSQSSGWPLLGVAGIPRGPRLFRRRRRADGDYSAQMAGHSRTGGAARQAEGQSR